MFFCSFFASFLALGVALFPSFALAQESELIVCVNDCGFADLIELANAVINFLMFQIAVPLATIGFAWAGWILMTSGGDPGAKKRAKDIGMNVLWGFGIAMSAWLIVDTIFDALLKPEIQTFTLALVHEVSLAPVTAFTWEMVAGLVS